jgi:hypothetical protein
MEDDATISKPALMNEASTSSSEEFTGIFSNAKDSKEVISETVAASSQRSEVRLKADAAKDGKTQEAKTEANRPSVDSTPKTTSSLVGRRLLAVSFDSEPRIEVAALPKKLSDDKNRSTVPSKEIKSDDDFEQPMRPVMTRPVSSLI